MWIDDALELALRRIRLLPARSVEDIGVRVGNRPAHRLDLCDQRSKPFRRTETDQRQARDENAAEASLALEMKEQLVAERRFQCRHDLELSARRQPHLKVGDARLALERME